MNVEVTYFPKHCTIGDCNAPLGVVRYISGAWWYVCESHLKIPKLRVDRYPRVRTTEQWIQDLIDNNTVSNTGAAIHILAEAPRFWP